MDNCCKKCRYVFIEQTKHDDQTLECRRYPPTLFNSGSLAKFPRVLESWYCGEFDTQ